MSLSIYLLSQAYLVPSSVDRYYVLLMSLWVMNGVSQLLVQAKQPSTLFMLFSEHWFIALWNDMTLDEEEGDKTMPTAYKEDLCLALLESLLLLRSEGEGGHQQMDSWILTALEAAEICSKALDWRVKHCQNGEGIGQKYLMYVEEVCLAVRNALGEEFMIEEYKIRT